MDVKFSIFNGCLIIFQHLDAFAFALALAAAGNCFVQTWVEVCYSWKYKRLLLKYDWLILVTTLLRCHNFTTQWLLVIIIGQSIRLHQFLHVVQIWTPMHLPSTSINVSAPSLLFEIVSCRNHRFISVKDRN